MPLVTESLVENRYRLGECLGGIAERRTRLAFDEQTDETVVFKSLFFGSGVEWEDYRPFEREVAVLPSLDHPGISPFRAAFWLEQPEGSYFCIVQKYVPGKSLAECMALGRRFDQEQLIGLADQLLEILAYLHSRQPSLVHRDIKPSNLILGEDGRIYLVDFGAVQVMGDEGRTLTAAGTFGYMAPEQCLGRAVPASDIYGLGATLLHLLTGRPPGEMTGSTGEMELPDHPALKGWFGKWLAQAIQYDASRRFTDGREALKAFEALGNGGKLYNSSIPASDLNRFVVLNADRQKLSVDLLNPKSWRMLKNTTWIAYALIIFSSVYAKTAINPALAPYLFPSQALTLSLILIMQLFPARGVRIEIDGDGCRLAWVVGSQVVWRETVRLWPQMELKLTESKFTNSVGGAQRRHLCLSDGRNKYCFNAYLCDTELDWLVEQFRFHCPSSDRKS
ncbi:MAG: serine/threonine protein kinase [Anaerolineae bacterium]|nr:serine/threonine protein kinase [Gloeobacterales cyanobacterium ES-bin-313]